MKRNDRTKEELAQSLTQIAEEIFALGEFPDIPKKTEFKEKLDFHSAKWNRAYREFVAEAFLFAKKLKYSSRLFKGSGIENGKTEELISLYSESLMVVVYRLFNKKTDKTPSEFISYLEASLKGEFKREMYAEKKDEKRQGITNGLSVIKQRILSDYNRFKENLEMLAKSRKGLTDEKIQELYIETSNRYSISAEQLRRVIIEGNDTSVILESDSIHQGKDGDDIASVFEFLYRGDSADTDLLAAEDTKQQEKKFLTVLDCIEKVWESKQERTKPYLRSLVTNDFLKLLCRGKVFRDKSYLSLLQTKDFADKELVSKFQNDETVCDRKELLKKFPILQKDGSIKLDKSGKPKYKDKGRASNDSTEFWNSVRELLGGNLRAALKEDDC